MEGALLDKDIKISISKFSANVANDSKADKRPFFSSRDHCYRLKMNCFFTQTVCAKV
jgi:hypothetical protein